MTGFCKAKLKHNSSDDLKSSDEYKPKVLFTEGVTHFNLTYYKTSIWQDFRQEDCHSTIFFIHKYLKRSVLIDLLD